MIQQIKHEKKQFIALVPQPKQYFSTLLPDTRNRIIIVGYGIIAYSYLHPNEIGIGFKDAKIFSEKTDLDLPIASQAQQVTEISGRESRFYTFPKASYYIDLNFESACFHLTQLLRGLSIDREIAIAKANKILSRIA